MDSKITKKRLNDYISYEWIVMLVIAFACCFLWELFYGIASVKPTVGQEFKYYFDVDVSTTNASSLHSLFKDRQTLSYDVIEFDYEVIAEEYETLGIRLSAYEGDAIFTGIQDETDGEGKTTRRANTIIDSWSVYSLDALANDAREYLKTFLKDSAPDGAEIDYANFSSNFDSQKISAEFYRRLNNDNRFRSKEQKEQGVKQEAERIEKLCKDVCDFVYFLQNASEQTFYRYTKYEQTYFSYKDLDEHWDYYKNLYRPLYEKEVSERANQRYAINLGQLTGGRVNPSLYVKYGLTDSANNVVVMAFNFKNEQAELQYETVSFMMTLIREFSDIVPAA